MDYDDENGDSSDAVCHMAFRLRSGFARGTLNLRDSHTQTQLLFLEIFADGGRGTIIFKGLGRKSLMECNDARRLHTPPSLNVGNSVFVR